VADMSGITELASGHCSEANRAYCLDGPEAGIEAVDRILGSAHGLTDSEEQYLRYIRLLYANVADPVFQPPPPADLEGATPLMMKSTNCERRGNRSLALSYRWQFAQYCPVGSGFPTESLEQLGRLLSLVGYSRSALAAEQLAKYHSGLLIALHDNPLSKELTGIALDSDGLYSTPRAAPEEPRE